MLSGAKQIMKITGRTLSGSMFSTSLSKAGMKLGAKWQFWKNTHFPRSIADFIIASARGPWKQWIMSRWNSAFNSRLRLHMHTRKNECALNICNKSSFKLKLENEYLSKDSVEDGEFDNWKFNFALSQYFNYSHACKSCPKDHGIKEVSAVRG